MENVYVFRVSEKLSSYNYELLTQEIVLLTCVQDVERYKEYLIKKHTHASEIIKVEVSNLVDELEPYDEVQQRLLSML